MLRSLHGIYTIVRRLGLLFLFAASAYAQSPVTVTGTIYDNTGHLATSGYVRFALSPASSSLLYYVTGVGIIAPQSTNCGINGAGAIKDSVNLANPCQVWGNDVITPGNTTYAITFAPNNIVTQTVRQLQITAVCTNLNTPCFVNPVTIVPQYQTITTSPIAVNLIPAADSVFNVGQAGKRYANGYFTNLTVTNMAFTNLTVNGLLQVAGSLVQKGNPIFDIRAAPYNGACDGVTDNTTPFHLARIDAEGVPGSTIFFPVGDCIFNSQPDSIGYGVKLQGQGWSTNTAVGTSLIRNYSDATTNGFITFDGHGTNARGTGSGVDDMTIGPAPGTTGGYLLKLTSAPGCVVGADCDNHRASDTKITNVFLGNGNGGTEACGLYIDGSQNVTPGSQGIRIVNANNLRVSSSTTADCSIWMNNVAHFFGSNIEIDTGFGATPGITVTGVGVAPNAAASANVYFSNMELVGDLVIGSASGVQTSGSVLVNGTTSMSANTANSILFGRFASVPTNSSTTSTWATVKSAVPFVVPALAATSTGVFTGAAGEVFSITSTTTGFLGMGSDHNVGFSRFASTKIGFVGSMFCATTTCSSGMNPGDIQAASAAAVGSYWFGTDNLSFLTRNAGGDLISKQNIGFRSGTAFNGLFTAPLTASRTYTFPDGPAAVVMTVNFTTAGATTSDVLTVTGMTASGHCNVSSSNALAATGLAAGTTWLDTPGANVITLHHTNTNGQVFTVSCTSI